MILEDLLVCCNLMDYHTVLMEVIALMVRKNGLAKRRKIRFTKERIRLLLLTLPFILFILLFYYVPLTGWSIAFFRYIPGLPLSEAKFVGLDNFRKIFSYGSDFMNVMKNTFGMSFMRILISWVPMVFAIALSEIKNPKLRKIIQTGSTLPHFISFVIVFSIFMTLFAYDDGIINIILSKMGVEGKGFNPMVVNEFTWVFQGIVIQIWKSLGWSSIIYIAAMAAIPQELYEAAKVDGANDFQKALYITLPSLMPTYMVLLILSIGHMLNGANFQQIFVFYNPLVSKTIETIDYYVYRIGLIEFNYSLSTSIGMFKSVVSISLLFTVNAIGKKILGRSVL